MTEFEKYIKSDFGVNTTSLYDYKNSMTPMVIEEREMRAVSMSVFDRLMMERIIWCAGPVNDRMSIIVQAQLNVSGFYIYRRYYFTCGYSRR